MSFHRPARELGTNSSTEGQGASMFPALLKPQDIALALGISRTHAYHLMRLGEIPTVRIGRRAVRVRPEDLQAYIDAHTYRQPLALTEQSLPQSDSSSAESQGAA